MLRPTDFLNGDKIGLEADEDEACWTNDGVRVDGQDSVEICCPCKCKCECEWCNFDWVADEMELALGAAADDTAIACEWDKLCRSEIFVKVAPSSGWLLWTITLLLVVDWVWLEVEDGAPEP